MREGANCREEKLRKVKGGGCEKWILAVASTDAKMCVRIDGFRHEIEDVSNGCHWTSSGMSFGF